MIGGLKFLGMDKIKVLLVDDDEVVISVIGNPKTMPFFYNEVDVNIKTGLSANTFLLVTKPLFLR